MTAPPATAGTAGPSGEPFASIAETHTGVVAFIGDRALKFKKPIAFPFVDYSSEQARRAACELEVELNRRLAPDVYVGVGELVGAGPDPEPVVVMRRLPASRRLSTLVLSGHDVSDDLRHLAHAIAGFHAAAPRTPIAHEAAGPAATRHRWETNGVELDAFAPRLPDPGAPRAVLQGARRYLAGRGPLLDRRRDDGWARDGHGDLLADDIFCLDDGPRVLDCLEFDERLRAGDVLADAAFLAMDLERLGRPDLGWTFLELHRRLLGDDWPASLAHHQIAYRAQVRAKVACLRADQGDAAALRVAGNLLGIARRHVDAGRVRLVLVGGSPGTGKTTMAGAVGGALGAVVLRSDEIRKELAGLPVGAHAPAPLDSGIYDPAWTAATYRELLDRSAPLLEQGESVVLDASWQDPSWRAAARALADGASADLTELRCTAPLPLAVERVGTRAAAGCDASDADEAVTAATAGRFPRWPEAVEVDTTQPLAESVATALAAIHATVSA